MSQAVFAMKDQNQYRLKAWELALLCALSLTLSAAVWAQGSIQRIEDGLIRLHVLAVSDDGEEQQIKLRVRDAVLSFLSPELETVTDKAEAERIVSKSLKDRFKVAPADQGCGRKRRRGTGGRRHAHARALSDPTLQFFFASGRGV